MVFFHSNEALSWLYHDFPVLRSRVGCQHPVISLSLKNLCQDIRVGGDLCPWKKNHLYSELFTVFSVSQ